MDPQTAQGKRERQQWHEWQRWLNELGLALRLLEELPATLPVLGARRDLAAEPPPPPGGRSSLSVRPARRASAR